MYKNRGYIFSTTIEVQLSAAVLDEEVSAQGSGIVEIGNSCRSLRNSLLWFVELGATRSLNLLKGLCSADRAEALLVRRTFPER
jgi:hypothetical protein